MILAELHAANSPDEEYRSAFSSFSKVPLKRGQTWRGRLVAMVERETLTRERT
jgi:hypothetical protein